MMSTSENNSFSSCRPSMVEISRILIESVKITLKPSATHTERQQAFEYIEKIKDDLQYALPCGYYLGSSEDPEVIHLGLQLLEESIRHHWNDLPINDKLEIKNYTMKLVTQGTHDLASEQIYIKDKISRLVVEIIKREWPQQWPGLLDELGELSQRGPSQAELVLLVFLRLAEDVETLQRDNHCNRRRDIYLALNSNMSIMFTMFFTILERHYSLYKELEQQQSTSANEHCRVTQVVYMTLGGFVEWVAMDHIMEHKTKLFISICKLIHDKQIRQSAAECFLKIVSKKSDRKQLLILFDKDVMDAIFSAAQLSTADDQSEATYLFLKTLFQVLTSLGTQLCLVWEKEPDYSRPETFQLYLNSVLAFMQHPSLTLYSYSNLLMIQLLKHEKAVQADGFIDWIRLWIPLAFSKLMKTGLPSKNNSERCKYSAMDFDCDADYVTFFNQTVTFTVKSLKQAALAFPELCFLFAEESFHRCLDLPIDNTVVSYSEPVRDKWNALTYMMDAILPTLLQSKNFKPPINQIKIMIKKCLQYNCHDPKVMSYLISCLSSLCAYLQKVPELKTEILSKLFSCFRSQWPPSVEAKEVFQLRNHLCAFVITLCKNNPNMMLTTLDLITNGFANFNDLITSEKGMVLQAQVILINEIDSFEVKEKYLDFLLSPYVEEWRGIANAVGSSSQLISFLGLDQSSLDPCYANRGTLWKCLTIFFNTLKTVRIPKVANLGKDGPYHNPGAQLFLSLAPSFFNMSKCLNSLILPESLKLHSEEFLKAHDIPVADVNTLLNRHNHDTHPEEDTSEETNNQKMKLFMRNIFSQLCNILGELGPFIGSTFYETPNLREVVLDTVLSLLTSQPDFKIRFILTGFYKRFILNCPVKLCETIIVPIVRDVSVTMMHHLNTRWAYAQMVTQSDAYDEEATDAKEVIDLSIIQIMTREYLDIVRDLLVNKTKPSAADLTEEGLNDAEMIETESKMQPQDPLSTLGRLILACDSTCESLIVMLCNALSWNDSMTSFKANRCLQCLLVWMFEERLCTLNEDVVKHITVSLLYGIHTHGKDAQNLTPLIDTTILFYEKLSPTFPVIKSTFLSIPEVKADSIEKFEELLENFRMNLLGKPTNKEKMKRETFKKVIEGVISKNVSEMFQRKILIKDLAPIFKNPRNPRQRLDERSNNLELCQLFGSSS